MISKSVAVAAVAALALGVSAGAYARPPAAPAFVAQAVADPGRPAADVARDPFRKPADMLAFAQVHPGETIVELLPGGGYFTRIFAKAVRPSGVVYAIVPASDDKAKPQPVSAIAADKAYANVKVVESAPGMASLPGNADLVWTSQNYHDLHLTRLKLDVSAVNKAIFTALKPGGLYVVVDHAAAPGSGLESVDTLHRIDPAVVRAEVEAAGFVFEGESDVLRNPADDHTKKVFDPSIRGHTDQFVYKFRKPK